MAGLAAGQRVAASVVAAGGVTGWVAAAVVVVVAAMEPAVSWVAATNQWVSREGAGRVANRADRPVTVAAAAMGRAILAAVAAAAVAMGLGPLAARVVARGVEASTALVARVVEAMRALGVAVERVAAKRVEAVGTLGRRGARSILEPTWRTCLAELTSTRARLGVFRAGRVFALSWRRSELSTVSRHLLLFPFLPPPWQASPLVPFPSWRAATAARQQRAG